MRPTLSVLGADATFDVDAWRADWGHRVIDAHPGPVDSDLLDDISATLRDDDTDLPQGVMRADMAANTALPWAGQLRELRRPSDRTPAPGEPLF